MRGKMEIEKKKKKEKGRKKRKKRRKKKKEKTSLGRRRMTGTWKSAKKH